MNQKPKMVFILNAVRFALLTFLAEKPRNLGKKTVRLALRDREREKCSNRKRWGTVRYGTVRYGIEDKFGSPTVML
jgi:hypothetical protein